MKNEDYKTLYKDMGFFWNEHLASCVAEFAAKEIPCLHYKTKETMLLRFFPSNILPVGRKYGQYELMVKFLGEEIAPVGDCCDGHIQLFLTESGKLIGFADYLLLRWGDEKANWRSSIVELLHGGEALEMGLIE